MKEPHTVAKTDMTGTKWELFKVAVNLCATKSYANVSVRDIAAAAKLNPASIYNHFSSKDAFLAEAYRFYDDNYHAYLPPLEDILALVPTAPPHDVWDKLHFIFEPELLDIMSKVIHIAINECHHDSRAEALTTEVFIEKPKRYITALLEEMIKQDMIEPLDIENFANIYCAFNLYASSYVGNKCTMSIKEWHDGYEYMFSLLCFKHK